jgi:hypothetical protein
VTVKLSDKKSGVRFSKIKIIAKAKGKAQTNIAKLERKFQFFWKLLKSVVSFLDI